MTGSDRPLSNVSKATFAFAAAVALTAVGTTAATAPEASAQVAAGRYSWTVVSANPPLGSDRSVSAVLVRGNTLIARATSMRRYIGAVQVGPEYRINGRVNRYRLVQTRAGGHFDDPLGRVVLTRGRGGAYRTTTYLGAVPMAHGTLIPR